MPPTTFEFMTKAVVVTAVVFTSGDRIAQATSQKPTHGKIIASDFCLTEEQEWARLDREAISGERLDAIAEYLRATGQASA
jgi:hypothetical protein